MDLAKSTYVSESGLVSEGPLLVLRESDGYDAIKALHVSNKPAKLGIMGGTFDPVHNGHIMCMEQAISQLELDVLLVIPTGKPAFKLRQPISPGQKRLHMCSLATSHLQNVALSAMEIARPGITYTAETLSIIRQCFPDCVKMYFIAGADSIYALPTWKRPEFLASVATYVCLDRDGKNSVETCIMYAARHGFDVQLLHAPKVDISASTIRTMVRENKPIDQFVNKNVAEYIYAEKLYIQ